jgi:hypothetical protein
MRFYALLPVLLIIFGNSTSNNHHVSKTQEKEYIEFFYQKVVLKANTLDSNGNPLSHIFEEATLKEGNYKIEITDGSGDLYQIVGTNYYLKFQLWYGWAGWREEGMLCVGKGFMGSYFVKTE